MSSHKNSYVPVFGDLDVTDEDYCIQVYHRVQSGGSFIKGRWREAKCFPNGFWDKESAKVLVRYLVFKEKQWNRTQTCKMLNTRLLRDNQLAGVCKQFHSSTYEIISYCFPEWNVKPWELSSCPNSFWSNPKNCKAVLQWICKKEGLHRDRKKFCDNISAELFRKYGVAKAMVKMGGLYALIDYTYPGKYKPWEFKKMAVVTEKIIIQAVRWMIDEQLGWTHDEVCQKIKVKTFYDHGIGGVLSKGCRHSPIVALQIAYPGEYTKDMLKNWENPFRK